MIPDACQPEPAGLAQPSGGKTGDGDYWNQMSNISTELKDQRSEYTGEIGVGTDGNGKSLFKGAGMSVYERGYHS